MYDKKVKFLFDNLGQENYFNGLSTKRVLVVKDWINIFKGIFDNFSIQKL